jgi:hypothetical protein
MDSEFASPRLRSAEHRNPQHRSPQSSRPVYEAATARAKGASPVRLLLLSLGVWAAIWATLKSLSSWLK